MKKITLLFILAMVTTFNSHGQLNISVDNPDGTGWNAYVNAFNISDGSYAFGFGYDLTKHKTEFDGSTVAVKPNYGIWVDACSDAAWFDGNTCPNPTSPNKNIEALSYLQFNRTDNPEFFNQDVVFSGNINSFTIDPSYTVKVFIAVFRADFGQTRRYETTISGTGTFSLTRPLVDVDADFTEQHFQYGFIIFGPPADPANEVANGSVVFQGPSLSTNDFELSQVKAFPNPTNNVWNINTNNQNIQSIAVYDVLGKEVFSSKPNASQAIIDSINFSNGLYFAKVKTINGESNLRLVKN